MKKAFVSVVGLALLLLVGGYANGQLTASETDIATLVLQLEAQAAEISGLRDRLDLLATTPGAAQSDALPPEPQGASFYDELDRNIGGAVNSAGNAQPAADKYEPPRFESDYDGGFILRPTNPDKIPFELKTNAWIQFRHHGFARDVETWTDNAGVTRQVRNRNAFDVERARLTFAGHALDERLTYFLQLDGDTDGRHGVDFFDYWWGWKVSDRLRLQFGKRKVPASRQWLLGARRTRFVDRPMANDFFRPDRTVGLYAIGQIGECGHYQAMVGNGYRTSNLPNSVTDDRLTFAMTNYYDLFGKYGSQLVDFDYTCDPLVRVGHSFVYSPQAADTLGTPLSETDFVRLSDGTRLNQVGALAPGVTVSDFDIFFYGVDFAFKYRGWSFDSEVFFRWIEEIEGDGAVAVDDLLQRGFYVEGGRFLVPKKLDFNVRYSQVDGLFGTASEYAAGINWYPLDTHKCKVSFDVTSLDGSPLQNTATDILVGDDGTLFRTQIQAEF